MSIEDEIEEWFGESLHPIKPHPNSRRIIDGGAKMKCCMCDELGVVLFPVRTLDGTVYKCGKCLNKPVNSEVKESEFPAYVLKWKLRDLNGREWIEEHNEMSLSDVEVVYGNNVHEILWMTMRQENVAII